MHPTDWTREKAVTLLLWQDLLLLWKLQEIQ
jgi:hypothetical protein